jgi:predicted nuclease with TOPRIM domain
MYLREQNHLKKKLDEANSKVDEIRAEKMAMEEKFNSLRLLSEKQNKKFEELYAVKTAKVSTPVKVVTQFICINWSLLNLLDTSYTNLQIII